MKVLLVDDDKYVIESLSMGINWENIGFTDVYLSYDIEKAKEILETEDIDIMLCDIEMPMGSGLDLLAWVRERELQIQNIFLTSYADFEYAKKALELDSFDYFLKPIDFAKLEEILRKAIIKCMEGKRERTYSRLGQYWMENQQDMKEVFWEKILDMQDPDEEDVTQLFVKYGFTCETNKKYQLLLAVFLEKSNRFTMEDTLKKLEFQGMVLETIQKLEEKKYLLLVRCEEKEGGVTKKSCEDFIHTYYFEKTCFYIGEKISLVEISYQKEKLLLLASESVLEWNNAVYCKNYEAKNLDYISPDFSRFELFIKNSCKQEALEEASKLLDGLKSRRWLRKKILELFRFDILQIMFAVLREKRIKANKLLDGNEEKVLYDNSLNSMIGMREYLDCCINKTIDYCKFIKKTKSVVERIQEYISDNLEEDITRNSLGEMLYLHPNSVVRLFKQETGMTLGQYLLEQRMEQAKEMLLETSLPVNVISVKTGYTNFSYFTKVFKDVTNMTPNEYRKEALCRK